MQLSQKPECIDLMLHDDLKDDYSFRTNIQDIASLLSGILNIMQQANLTDKELAELEQLYYDGALKTVFKDGEMCYVETFKKIRNRLNGGN